MNQYKVTIYLIAFFLFSLPQAHAIDRQSLISYAEPLNGLKKEELKTAVHLLIGTPATLDYGSGDHCTWWGFYYTDRIEETNECVNRYSATMNMILGKPSPTVDGSKRKEKRF